jgi:DNA-binding XRE family transcriptional regulator
VVLAGTGFEHGVVIELAVTLAASLRHYRERAHLSQEALAYAADLHPNAIGFLERGLRDPRLETLLAIARALSAEMDERVTAADLIAGVE